MTSYKPIKPVKTFMGKLGFGCDLLEGLTKVCTEQNITLGRVEAIGAVKSARIGFYNQESRLYEYLSLDCPLEITHLTGNVSLKDGVPFVHAHVTLADREGKCHGGHLVQGTTVFACEFILEAYEGTCLERKPDDETGLYLWSSRTQNN